MGRSGDGKRNILWGWPYQTIFDTNVKSTLKWVIRPSSSAKWCEQMKGALIYPRFSQQLIEGNDYKTRQSSYLYGFVTPY